MKMRVWALIGLIVFLAIGLLTGCGHYICHQTLGNSTCTVSGGGINQGGGGGSSLKVWGYQVDFSWQSQHTVGMALDLWDTSIPRFTAESSFTAPTMPNFPTGAVIVQKNLMYIPSSDGTLFSYQIDLSSGTPTPLTQYVVAGGDSIATNPAGTLLFVGDTSGEQVTVYTVNSGGLLTNVGTFSSSPVRPKVMTTDGTSTYLYISDGTSTSKIGAFTIGSNGTLAAVTNSPFSFTFGLSAIAGEKSGKYLIGVTGAANDNSIHVLAINGGALSGDVSGSPFATQNSPISLVVHQNGAWVYIFNKNYGPSGNPYMPAEGYLIGAGGALTKLPGSPYATIAANGGVIDQGGQYLFASGFQAVGSTNNIVSACAINSSTGDLTNNFYQVEFTGLGNSAFAVADNQ
jgi:hypothetical protein